MESIIKLFDSKYFKGYSLSISLKLISLKNIDNSNNHIKYDFISYNRNNTEYHEYSIQISDIKIQFKKDIKFDSDTQIKLPTDKENPLLVISFYKNGKYEFAYKLHDYLNKHPYELDYQFEYYVNLIRDENIRLIEENKFNSFKNSSVDDKLCTLYKMIINLQNNMISNINDVSSEIYSVKERVNNIHT